jgi:hypothetical protein
MPVHVSMPIRVNDRQLPYSPSLALNRETFVAHEHSMSALAILHQVDYAKHCQELPHSATPSCSSRPVPKGYSTLSPGLALLKQNKCSRNLLKLVLVFGRFRLWFVY